MALIAFDARDASVRMPHGSGIYVRHRLAALKSQLGVNHDLWPLIAGGRGPKLWWEQVTLPRLLGARGVSLVHSPDSFLPLRRPCPGVVTIHDLAFEALPGDIGGLTGLKYRALVRRAALSAQRVISPSRFTAHDLNRRYGVLPERIRVIPEAPALPPGSAPVPEGLYVLAAGDLRPKKNLPCLVDAYRLLRADGIPHRLVLAGADVSGTSDRLRRLAGPGPLELTGFVGYALLREPELLGGYRGGREMRHHSFRARRPA